MPELRQNLATKEWVIIAHERALKPDEFRKAKSARPATPKKKDDCPFCPGNEKMTDPATFTLGAGNSWRARSVPNRYPALVPNPGPHRAKQSLYRSLPGEGIHEVVIETPRHDEHPAIMEPKQFRDVVSVYQERFKASLQNNKVALTMLFKNHGESAGTSLEHPHSQLIGSCVVPSHVRHRMDEAQKYHEQNGACVFCRMTAEERKQGERIVAETDHFVAFVLYAALSPFHIWLLPKRHMASFGDMTAEEVDDFAATLQGLLKKLNAGLDNPDYNYVIQSTPLDRGTPECFHWYLSLVVRLSKMAGFELGSGMYINPAIPEESAKFLNNVKA
ncbi:MAG: galactose-1-phosphate uridylyltransferase [Elusimicrobia bacterium]|nr:galactose-1-phosphate uridylyltransferase [Elusimicrobiota bacterium]